MISLFFGKIICFRECSQKPIWGGGHAPWKIFKIEHSEMLFPVNQFPRQGWSSLKFSLKSKKEKN